MRLVWGEVREVGTDLPSIQRLLVALDDGSEGPAVVYPLLSGRCRAGDRVLVNTTAVDLGLGTGGAHFVVARLGEGTGVALDARSGGHIMKLRYSPVQTDVVSVESPEAASHETMRTATSLEGMPVVCCGLHSQVPLVAASVKAGRPDARVAYCMTDGAALALPLSDVVRATVDAGLVDTTVSCGQAFGGHLEAVNLHSGLLAARHVAHADVAIVAIGPGVVGTATPLGHGGVAQGEAINAVGVLGGRPVACLRISFADQRPRHRGVSHHSASALATIALTAATVAVPVLGTAESASVDADLGDAGVWERHVRADSPGDVPDLRGVRVTTMGRAHAEDPAFFAAAFAAGEVAAAMIDR